MAIQMVRLKDVCTLTGLSKTSIYRMEKEGQFPSRVKIGKRSVAWYSSDIDEFLNTRPNAK